MLAGHLFFRVLKENHFLHTETILKILTYICSYIGIICQQSLCEVAIMVLHWYASACSV